MVAVLSRCRCARLCLGGGGRGVCGAAGVPGAARSVLWAGLRRGWWPARWAGLLGVAVGGGPPASRPRRELRSARRLEAWPGPAATSLISHVIPLWLIQTLNLHRWNCNVFGASRKMTAINYVRDLGTAVSSPPMGTAAWPSCPCGALRASGAWCAVMASPSLPRMRYKVRHAWLLAGENGTKFAMHAKNVPKRAILGEQGEFCTAHAARRGLLGEFCTGSGAVRVSSCRSSVTHGRHILSLRALRRPPHC